MTTGKKRYLAKMAEVQRKPQAKDAPGAPVATLEAPPPRLLLRLREEPVEAVRRLAPGMVKWL